jgi:hypothetical protein
VDGILPKPVRPADSRVATDYRSATIRFLANGAWVHDRDKDVRGCVGSGFLALAMSHHPRLGRGSPLRALDTEVLQMISNCLIQ